MATSVVNPRVQFFANNGRPLIGGRIHTYVAGSSTRARTYKDAAKAQPNTNPIILDGRGEAQIYLVEGVEYKFVVEDGKGALIYTQEPVYGAVWPNAEQWPSDATLSYQFMMEAKAAADAVSLSHAPFDTYAQLAHYEPSLGDGVYEVSRDETRDGARTRYKKEDGVLAFILAFEQYYPDGASHSRAMQSKLGDTISVRDYITTRIDGVTSNQAGIEAAVAAAYAAGAELEWPAGVYVSDANIPNFHDVQHSGKGVIKRGSSTYRVKPSRDTVRVLYVAPDGSSVNDGIDASRPITIGKAIAVLDASGPIRGRQQIVGAPGVYSEIVAIPRGLALNNNYLEFKFPPSPGVRGDPENWPVDGAILDGAAFRDTSTNGFDVGAYNNVSVEYLLFRGWKRNGVADTSQVKNAVNVNEFANLYLLNCCGFGNGWCNVSINPRGRCVITGGDYLGARYVINNTGGRLSFTANASTYTRVRGGLEYGLYQKHDSSTVMDYTEFSDNGKHPAAVGYGAAIFAYKSNASVDTRGCKFYRNNIDFNLRGGVLSTSIPDDNVYGVGADASSKRFLVQGNGSDDMQDWRARGVREINRATGGSSFANTTLALIHDPYAEIRSGYFCDNLQRLDIDVLCNVTNAAATLEPSLVMPSGRVPILTITSEVNEYARLFVSVQPVFGETSLSYTYSYYGSAGTRHGHGSLALDPRGIPLSVELWGSVGTGGNGAVRDMRVKVFG